MIWARGHSGERFDRRGPAPLACCLAWVLLGGLAFTGLELHAGPLVSAESPIGFFTNVATRLKSRNLFEELTPREIDVLREVAKGLSNKELADTLGITEHTAKDHLKSILAKLRVADRTQAVTTALQRGIIHL